MYNMRFSPENIHYRCIIYYTFLVDYPTTEDLTLLYIDFVLFCPNCFC